MIIKIIITSCDINILHKYIYIYGNKTQRQYYNVNLCYLSTFGYSINLALILDALWYIITSYEISGKNMIIH